MALPPGVGLSRSRADLWQTLDGEIGAGAAPSVAPAIDPMSFTTMPLPGAPTQVVLPGAPTPVIAGALAAPAAAVGTLALGAIRSLLIRFGPAIVRTLIGAGAFAWVMSLIDAGASDDTLIPIKPGRRAKRYSIGTNPRLNTLLKVGKRVDNIFVRYDKRISKFRSRLRGYSRPRRQAYHPPSQYLSPVERRHARR